MERLKQRLAVARQALSTFREVLELQKNAVIRDASIQRFEYTFEAMWKAAQAFLAEVEGRELASPKGVIRACFHLAILEADQAQLAINMTNDRNLTAHTYNEALADAIYSRLPLYAELIVGWLDAMESRLPPPDGLA